MENGRDVRMAQLRGGARLAQKALPRRVILQVCGINDLQRSGAAQIRIKRLVRDAHRAATQLPRTSIGSLRDFVVLKTDRHGSGRHQKRAGTSRTVEDTAPGGNWLA